MGKPERKIRERFGSSRSYFLRCFGISRKIHSEKPKVEIREEKKKKTRSTHWLLRSIKPRLKNDKNIPATVYEVEKQHSNVEDDKQNLFRVMIRHETTDQKNMAANAYKTVEQETKEKYMNEERDINPDPLSFLGYDTCNEEEEKTGVREWKPDPVGLRSKKSKSSRIRKGSRVGSFDPLIGILIIMVTLMIMLMWGRLCAIICTSTWCYFLPRLKDAAVAKCKRGGGSKAEEGGSFPSDLELNSEAYKKKVVLEGFLLRQHRV